MMTETSNINEASQASSISEATQPNNDNEVTQTSSIKEEGHVLTVATTFIKKALQRVQPVVRCAYIVVTITTLQRNV